jgi:hypothetical protein
MAGRRAWNDFTGSLPGVIQRVWLDWNMPCLPAAAKWLIAHTAGGDTADLREWVFVLPGRRAGRVLLGYLVEAATQAARRLVPPRHIVTPGPMVDVLLGANDPVATRVEIELSWARALCESTDEQLASLVPGRPRDGDDIVGWLPLAQRIVSIHEELGGELRGFSDAGDAAGSMEMLREAARWQALSDLQVRYERVLGEAGLVDPHASRRKALRGLSMPPPAVGRIVLVGVSDLNTLQREAIKAAGVDVLVMIHAEESRADSFDDLGCVRTDRWRDAKLDIDDSLIRIVDRPDEQAQEILDVIAAAGASCGTGDGDNGLPAADEISIGLGDESLAGAIERAGRWAGIEFRSSSGRELATSPPLTLLSVIANWLNDPRFVEFAQLIRHPDLERWLMRQGRAERGIEDWVSLLDRYFDETLQERLTGQWLGRPDVQQRLRRVYDAVQALLEPLRGSARSLGAWAEPTLQVLNRIYGGLPARQHEPLTREALEQVASILAESARLPREIQPAVTGDSAIRFLLAQSREARIPEPLEDGQVEMLGWLELHLDPAPMLIVAGVNDGSIPSTKGADPFLPNSLRARLGLVTADRLYARDRYLLEAIVRSRRRCTLISGRRDSNGEPLAPSRLLLACDDSTLVRRVQAMSHHVATERRNSRPRGIKPAAARSAFTVPALPPDLAAPEFMRITDFKLYLDCPYRYALQRLAGLKAIQIRLPELDPPAFGSLAHDVLCAFGQCPDAAGSADVATIEDFLLDTLRAKAREAFGESLSPGIRVQLAQLEQRMRDFATFQAEQRAAGWMIMHCEIEFDRTIALDIPGAEPMPLRGRIDRIDYNDVENRWRVLDYKTSDSGRGPIESHHKKSTIPTVGAEMTWRDLQLPLYRYLVLRSEYGISDRIDLGYIVLPKQSGGAALKIAPWSREHLNVAEDTARRIVADIRRGEFAMNPDFRNRFDVLARVCHAMVLEDDDSEEGLEP